MPDEESVELGSGSDLLEQLDAQGRSLEQAALVNAEGCCASCGGDHKLRARQVVPPEAGGRATLENSIVLCRACEMAFDTVSGRRGSTAKRPINFWVSRALYDSIKGMRGSMGALVRYLMCKYLEDPDRFDDLSGWEAPGSEVKINVWVAPTVYEAFKNAVNARELTVTVSLKALLLMYRQEAEARFGAAE